MKLFIKIILCLTFGILSIISFKHFEKSITREEKRTECKVLENYVSETTHKHHVTEDFILILQDPKGRIFDMYVRPSTYYVANKDKHICLMLSEQDITKKNDNKSLGYLISCFIFGVLSLVFLVSIFIVDED